VKIRLLFVGRAGDADLASATERYRARAARHVPTEVVFVKEETPGKRPDVAKILRAEAERISEALKPRDLLVVCDAGGREMTSESFAGRLREWLDESPSSVVFLVGGAFGIDPALRAKARAILPLSRLTLPHQIARLLMAEQIYRAVATLHGVAYSK
jgi:23S rRNA (pseudouridine1915-N3)-methyltransferase